MMIEYRHRGRPRAGSRFVDSAAPVGDPAAVRHLPAAAVLVAVAAAAAAPAPATAQPAEKGRLGLGIILGEPTGVSAKLFLGARSATAVDVAAGSAVVNGGLQVHADYLWHPLVLTQEEKFALPLYLGPGVRFLDDQRGRDANDYHLGLRLVVGLAFDFTTVPLDVFVEIAGVGDYIFSNDSQQRGFGLGLNGGAGVRYWF
jgi:hypothetical protein